MKQLFHQPRPYWVGNVQALSTETSYGIPSTHASDSFAAWAYLGVRLQKAWLWTLAVVLILLIGISRIYLGVHFPHDVIFGWLIGAVAIFIFVRLEERIIEFLQAQTIGRQILTVFALSIIILLIAHLIHFLVQGASDPEAWAQYSILSRSPSHFYTVAGAFMGATNGYLLMVRLAPFKTSGTPAQKIGRYFLGIVGLILIWKGLDSLFGLVAPEESLFGYFLRYIRYGATGVWATFLAPLIFLRLKLANPASKASK